MKKRATKKTNRSKRATAKKLSGPRVEVTTPDGKILQGTSVEFETEKDFWSLYRLEDGSRLKVRVLVIDIVVTDEQVETGDPLVVVSNAVIVKYEKPKKKPKRKQR